MKTCWFCPNPLEGNHRTGEHVIPNAIGGRKEVFNFICRTCNGTRGEAWEAELAKQFLWFSSAAGVKRSGGGKHPDFRVQTVSGEKLKLRADSVLVPDGHEVSTEESGDKIDVSIRASDSKTMKNLLKKAARDYPEFDFEKATIRSESVDSYLDEPLSMDFRYGGPAGGRSMVKSSLALLSEVNDVDISTCGRALTYLLDPSPEAPSPFCFFFDADLVVNRPKDHLFHCVSVIGQALEMTYQSMTSPIPKKRLVSPKALGFDGHRWHVRVYCHQEDGFRDFVIARILSLGNEQQPPTVPPIDQDWETLVTLVLAPNPGLPDAHQRVIELDYGMVNGELRFECKRALLLYVVRNLGLDSAEGKAPRVQQIVLRNLSEIAPLLPAQN